MLTVAAALVRQDLQLQPVVFEASDDPVFVEA